MEKTVNIGNVKQFIVNNFLFGEGDAFLEDTSFLDKGIIDSTGFLELISFLEKHFSIHIADDELLPENLDSLKNIAVFLERKLSVKS